jgi:catechol 2,3-dioxygenase-like lactoylglutathione lyase family enzyme
MKAKFGYVGIRVTNLQKSINFYTKLLGMNLIHQSKNELTCGEIAVLQSEKGGPILELNYYREDSPYNTRYTPGEGLDHLAFKVDNLDEALREAERAGYRTTLKLRRSDGRWAYIEDPDGNWIEFY